MLLAIHSPAADWAHGVGAAKAPAGTKARAMIVVKCIFDDATMEVDVVLGLSARGLGV